MNPYEVLGLKPGASDSEIKNAYRLLIKKYHPDKYIDNPLRDLAEQKMREINEAYDILTKNGSSQNNNSYSYSNNNSSYSYENRNSSNSYNYNDSNVSEFNSVRNFINTGNFSAAESLLKKIFNHNAEWHYLNGIIMANKGWYDSAYENLSRAVQMNPNNFEYQKALNQMSNRTRHYSNNYYRRSSRNSDDMCDFCCKIWVLDSLCECFGGDIISCI